VLPVGEALAALLAPHGEIALHDLAADRIVALWTPISGRSVGDPP
jgi:predicted transcriptional regulator YheO